MPRAREQIICLEETPYYHCMARCVRRAFLCGVDSATGDSFEHRKQWVVDQLGVLDKVFCIDICAYAVMSNHYHVVLKVNEALADELSVKEVLTRWLSLFKGNLMVQRYLAGVEQPEEVIDVVEEIANKMRKRLTDISWFMRCLNESIARKANAEDGCTGRFWEGRFKSQALLDEAAVLACMVYVDLNPIRSGLAKNLQQSDYASIQIRLDELLNRKVGRPKKKIEREGDVPELVSLNVDKLNSKENESLIDKDTSGLSTHVLEFSLSDYVELVDWTGRAILANKLGYIPDKEPPILAAMGINSENWLEHVPKLGTQFHHGIGTVQRIKSLALSLGRKWMHGLGAANRLFLTKTPSL